MIVGIGIDIIEIERIRQAVEKNSRFLDRFFTPEELKLLSEKNYRSASIAGFFAAKEAAVKAMGTGFRGFGWQDIEICQNTVGKPRVRTHHQAKHLTDQLGIQQILVSISHSRDNAVAQAIAIGKTEEGAKNSG